MRGIGAGAFAILVLWVAYLVSPYWAAARFTAAVARGDVLAVAEGVNLQALRVSLTRQLVAEGIAAGDIDAVVGSREAQFAAGAVLAVAGPLVSQIASARGAIDLARETPVPDLQPASREVGLLARASQYVWASRWRGFRNVYLSLPPDRPQSEQVRLQFRLSRLSWRLVGIDLPVAVRGRLARSVERLSPRLRPAP